MSDDVRRQFGNESWSRTFISDDDHAETGLRDVCVNHEGLIFRRGRIFAESFVAPMYAVHYKTIGGYGRFLAKNYVLRRSKRLPAGLWVVDNFSPGNYHHWIVDCLARLVDGEARHRDIDAVLLPDYYAQSPYVPFTLQAFPRLRVEWIGPRANVRVGRLPVVRHPAVVSRRPPVYYGEPLHALARRLAALVETPGATQGVYFTREDAGRRRASNERDVRRVLSEYEIATLRVDPARPWEQIQAAVGAKVVVGVHGAALTNMIFLPPGGHLLELRRNEDPEIFFFDHYHALARAMGLGYTAQYCETAQAAIGYELNNADVLVDLDLLRVNLESALAG